MSETPPDLTEAEQTLRAVSDVSLRLMAGCVSKPKLAQLRITVAENTDEYPWQTVTQAVLSEEVDQQRLVQQGLVAHRDWILRGGRTAKGPSITRRAKGLLARLVAQLIFAVIFTTIILVALVILQIKLDWDLYAVWPWIRSLFGK
ncbi:MAG TPA: hypothetical protein EYP98_09900 [Planctomycetes bacterium]|nr:hypothetical protein [Planctomycetota bacterium]